MWLLLLLFFLSRVFLCLFRFAAVLLFFFPAWLFDFLLPFLFLSIKAPCKLGFDSEIQFLEYQYEYANFCNLFSLAAEHKLENSGLVKKSCYFLISREKFLAFCFVKLKPNFLKLSDSSGSSQNVENSSPHIVQTSQFQVLTCYCIYAIQQGVDRQSHSIICDFPSERWHSVKLLAAMCMTDSQVFYWVQSVTHRKVRLELCWLPGTHTGLWLIT